MARATPTRNAREEARVRLGGEYDVRVLEPSPPAVTAPPFFADDPVAGGDVVPVERDGAESWAAICDARGDSDLRAWCATRWLVRGELQPLPDTFTTTRNALHALAEHVIAPARWAVNGKIGLRYTWHGFGTPFFGDDEQVRIEGDALVVAAANGEHRAGITTLRDMATAAGIKPGAPADVYTPTTAVDVDEPLAVDAASAIALGDWFGFGASVLEQLRADALRDTTPPDEPPGRVQIWPEHFDIAVDLGRAGSRANFGASPGDAEHGEPYLYVGPWEPRQGPFWNESWGASLPYSDLLAGADPMAFFATAQRLLAR